MCVGPPYPVDLSSYDVLQQLGEADGGGQAN